MAVIVDAKFCFFKISKLELSENSKILHHETRNVLVHGTKCEHEYHVPKSLVICATRLAGGVLLKM